VTDDLKGCENLDCQSHTEDVTPWHPIDSNLVVNDRGICHYYDPALPANFDSLQQKSDE